MPVSQRKSTKGGSSRALTDANQKLKEGLDKTMEGWEKASTKAKSKLNEVKEKVKRQQDVVVPKLEKQVSQKAKPAVRRFVTGSEDTKVRDWLEKYHVVKTWDKLNMVLGVIFIQLTQYMMLRWPDYFKLYFVFCGVILMLLRWYLYRKGRMHYFLLDYCYLTNTLCIINCVAFPNSPTFWKINFAAANGPLMFAILAWRNSLVFHSLDKQTSVFIHVVPALLMYVERWIVRDSPMCPPGNCQYGFKEGVLGPMFVYFCWQCLYLIQTEVIDRKKFEKDPTLMTSLRWIAKDKKNLVHQLILRFGRETKLMEKDEELDMKKNGPLIIGVFVLFQFSYTFATILPSFLFFRFQVLHGLYIVFILVVAVWNGAGYYFEVFARRYIDSIEKLKKKEKKRSTKRQSSKRDSKSAKLKAPCAMPTEKERLALVAEESEPEDEPSE